ncbi:MAG: gamma-glutamylcyclotransferase family protein [Nanoarchaeota archaeon]
MLDLFVYGTLMGSELRNKLLGRKIDAVPDSLYGFKKIEINIENEKYLGIVKNGNSSINGLIIKITNEELRLLDEYEGESYKRESVVLKSGNNALTYVVNF